MIGTAVGGDDRIDQDVGDILDVAHLVGAAANLEQRIVMRGPCIGRVEEQAVRETCAPAGGQLPVLALDVVDDGRAGPAQQRRHDQTHALARPRRRERHDVLRALMPQVAALKCPEEGSCVGEKAGPSDVRQTCPAGGTIGRDMAALPCTPQRSSDSRAAADKAAGAGDHARAVEHLRRIGVEVIPPPEQRPGAIDRATKRKEPRRSELGLIAERRGGPLRRYPDAAEHDRKHDQDLAYQQLGWGHGRSPPRRARGFELKSHECRARGTIQLPPTLASSPPMA
jgi:hypothetical protein